MSRISPLEVHAFEEWILENYRELFEEWELDASQYIKLDEWLELEHWGVLAQWAKETQ